MRCSAMNGAVVNAGLRTHQLQMVPDLRHLLIEGRSNIKRPLPVVILQQADVLRQSQGLPCVLVFLLAYPNE